jgi:hypothetical protein
MIFLNTSIYIVDTQLIWIHIDYKLVEINLFNCKHKELDDIN